MICNVVIVGAATYLLVFLWIVGLDFISYLSVLFFSFFFFFSSRRRHTRFDCDWSSDVCSSDLAGAPRRVGEQPADRSGVGFGIATLDEEPAPAILDDLVQSADRARHQDRKSVV